MKPCWSEQNLIEVCKIIGGGTPSKSETHFYQGNIPWATVRDMNNNVIHKTEFSISEEAVKKSSTHVIPSGNVVIATRVGLGKVCLLAHDTAINQDLKGLIPRSKTKIHVPFLFYWLKTMSPRIIENGTGATVQGVKLSFIENLKIPLPPLPEQQRIIAILDEAFADIDQAKSNAERNLRNARELFEKYVTFIFTHPGKDWELRTIEEICNNLDSKRIPVTKCDRKKGKFPYYGASGIVDYVMDFIFDEDLLLVSEDGANLLARTYPIAFSITGKTWVNNHAHVLRFKYIETQKFVEHFINSIDLGDYVNGMAQPKLNQKMLNSIKVPFPQFEIQKSLVKKFETLSMETKKLEATYQQKLVYLEELKSSLLQKAFKGEL